VFGAKKLPDMARSVGQSARVLKGEMKGLKQDAAPAAEPAPPVAASALPVTDK
jgi:sec-independent protein translocase protein TatA